MSQGFLLPLAVSEYLLTGASKIGILHWLSLWILQLVGEKWAHCGWITSLTAVWKEEVAETATVSCCTGAPHRPHSTRVTIFFLCLRGDHLLADFSSLESVFIISLLRRKLSILEALVAWNLTLICLETLSSHFPPVFSTRPWFSGHVFFRVLVCKRTHTQVCSLYPHGELSEPLNLLTSWLAKESSAHRFRWKLLPIPNTRKASKGNLPASSQLDEVRCETSGPLFGLSHFPWFPSSSVSEEPINNMNGAVLCPVGCSTLRVQSWQASHFLGQGHED